ncbi:MAG: polyketide synthase, partial [Chloroflexi bacterium]
MDSKREPIAITGIGCRFPGGINSTESFWQLLRDEVDAISEIPSDRFDVEALYDTKSQTPGKIVTREGGFLDNIDQFDAGFFGISPREANFVDPQQRLLLEVAWEALENSGQVPGELLGSQTGVFVGMWTNDYEDRMYKSINDIDLYITTGGGRYSASGRLSYAFDFRGPSLTVDTACSSSLVTVHLACHSLWSGESTMAVAGGVNLILEPHITIGYSRSRMLSPDARCKFGDARANGYVRSEGVGLIVLKPLSQAVADGDPIYALIRGSAVNNDGRSSELLVAPGIDTQVAMLREAYRSAGVNPGDVTYVEAHGTGTGVGDPVEIQSLGIVLGEDRPADQPCILGSVKTNIGHTEAASGIAGLIKAVLALKNRAIPASLHLQTPNPKIPWDELPVQIQTSWRDWPEGDGPAIAGVNSFGVTGTNAHIVLQEAPQPNEAKAVDNNKKVNLIPLSAHTSEALNEMAQRFASFLAGNNDGALAMDDFGYATAVSRTHHPHRLTLVAHDQQDLSEHLQAFLNGEMRPGMAVGQKSASQQHKVVFVFSGQGSHWLGMGRQLLAEEPVFRDAMERCEETLRPLTNWSLLEQLAAAPDSLAYRLNETNVMQPTLVSIEIALAALWQSYGI